MSEHRGVILGVYVGGGDMDPSVVGIRAIDQFQGDVAGLVWELTIRGRAVLVVFLGEESVVANRRRLQLT